MPVAAHKWIVVSPAPIDGKDPDQVGEVDRYVAEGHAGQSRACGGLAPRRRAGEERQHIAVREL